MKAFKLVDFVVSVVLLLVFGFMVIWNNDRAFIGDNFLLGYLVVGTWHVLSMLAHFINRYFIAKWSVRFWYHWICLILLTTMPLGSFWLLAFTAPFMAIFYTYLCGYELFIKMNERPLAILK
jgi:hypothetical protein